MKTKTKRYKLNFVMVEDRSKEIARTLAKNAFETVARKNNVVFTNLDEVLDRNIN